MNKIKSFFEPSLGNSLLIPEVACAHLGNLTLSYAYIDYVASVGLKTVKFQAHDPLHESSPTEQFRILDDRIPYKDRYSYWEGTSFSIEEWQNLSIYAKNKGLLFCITPNSRQIAEALFKNIKVDIWKVGSSDIDNYHLLDFLDKTNIPVIISTGLGNSRDVETASKLFSHDSIAFLSCISKYPAPLEEFKVSRLQGLRTYCKPTDLVGLSDHSATITPSLITYVHGFRIFEFHINLSEHIFNFDASSSLLPDQVILLIRLFNEFSQISNESSNELDVTNKNVKSLFSKRIYSSTSIPKGTRIKAEHLAMIRSNDTKGLSQSEYFSIVGQISATDIPMNTPINKDQITK